jgi:hypothetical protein
MKKFYICGPITEMPNQNREAFAEMEKFINSIGHIAVNPHKLFEDAESEGYKWKDFIEALSYRPLTECRWLITPGMVGMAAAELSLDSSYSQAP